MDGAATEIGENVDFVHALGSSLGMDSVIGEQFGRGGMQPLQFRLYSTSAFVEVYHVFLLQQLANFFNRIESRFSRAINNVNHGAFCPGCAQKIVKSFGSALVGE